MMAGPGFLIAPNFAHEDAVSLFIEQFKGKPNLDAWAKSYLKQVQDLEDATFEIIFARVLEAAVGVQLSIIGEIVGQPRTTSDDDRYRTMIRARIAINLSHATAEDLITIAALILSPFGESFRVRDEPPAQIRVEVLDPLISTDADLFFDLLDLADPAGVRLLLQWQSTLATSSDKLLLSNEIDGESFGGGGLGSTTGPTTTAAGKLSSVIG